MQLKRISLAGSFLLLGVFLLFSADRVMAASYNTLYVFGDSYSDIGAGYLDGNGPTAVAYLAEHMGIPFTHSQDPSAGSKSLDFAVSGAQTGKGPGKMVGGVLLERSMMDQVEDFASRVKSGKIVFNPESTLFFLAGGLNDKTLSSETTVKNVTALVKMLKGLGARHFSVAVLPEQIPAFSEVAKRINPLYRRLVPKLRSKLVVDIKLNGWGSYFDEVMKNPAKYGIVNTIDRCAGRAIFQEDTVPRGAPETYFYYHDGHPSTAVHKIVGQKLYQEIVQPATR